ncbi:hypothetical protein CYLTODRAFT_474966 [Cylindrobasidium torrendii FP15055 ss-10]|uniref:Uncharacterized protein n=1 Tax=Cylindrobasidium torrendii FP15055 ss-10 TaxID=1314674 RepID=A0A0D7AVQ0_9AGAR|nr:hypothetical protein CYLTODRAFT_474966 [Cylindrobasidium torrendii FP15055 ss-10]
MPLEPASNRPAPTYYANAVDLNRDFLARLEAHFLARWWDCQLVIENCSVYSSIRRELPREPDKLTSEIENNEAPSCGPQSVEGPDPESMTAYNERFLQSIERQITKNPYDLSELLSLADAYSPYAASAHFKRNSNSSMGLAEDHTISPLTAAATDGDKRRRSTPASDTAPTPCAERQTCASLSTSAPTADAGASDLETLTISDTASTSNAERQTCTSLSAPTTGDEEECDREKGLKSTSTSTSAPDTAPPSNAERQTFTSSSAPTAGEKGLKPTSMSASDTASTSNAEHQTHTLLSAPTAGGGGRGPETAATSGRASSKSSYCALPPTRVATGSCDAPEGASSSPQLSYPSISIQIQDTTPRIAERPSMSAPAGLVGGSASACYLPAQSEELNKSKSNRKARCVPNPVKPYTIAKNYWLELVAKRPNNTEADFSSWWNVSRKRRSENDKLKPDFRDWLLRKNIPEQEALDGVKKIRKKVSDATPPKMADGSIGLDSISKP